jgi:hypothetical protein
MSHPYQSLLSSSYVTILMALERSTVLVVISLFEFMKERLNTRPFKTEKESRARGIEPRPWIWALMLSTAVLQRQLSIPVCWFYIYNLLHSPYDSNIPFCFRSSLLAPRVTVGIGFSMFHTSFIKGFCLHCHYMSCEFNYTKAGRL